LNFGPKAVRPTFNLYDEEKVQTDLATRDKTLADMRPGLFTKNYLMKAYNFEDGDINVPEAVGTSTGSVPTSVPATVPPGAAGTELAEQSPAPTVERNRDDIDELLASLSDDDLKRQIEGPLKPVIELINGLASYEEVMDKIASVYPKMDDSEFQKTIGKAMFLAEVDGRMKTQSVK
jgi:hypothetical protein